MRKLVILVSLMVSAQAFAATGSITKSATPGNIYGTEPAASSSRFSVISVNFPAGTLNLKKTITSVQCSWQHYRSGTTDKVELCYDRPYQTGQQYCFPITASQTGVSTSFNSQPFDIGSSFSIRHTVSGTQSPKMPSLTPDSITINYSY